MNLSEVDKQELKSLIDRGEPLPERYRWALFQEPRETELIWPGKTHEVTTAVLPFQSIEQIDEARTETAGHVGGLFDLDLATGRQMGGWSNKLIWGDNKLVLSSLKNGPLRREIEEAGGLKLVYIDPPFDVGADFSFEVEVGEESLTKEPSAIEELAYRDTWGRGRDSFITMLYERLILVHSLLAEDGSLFLHCDWRVSALVRQLLDEVFGVDFFRNEIIWHYQSGGRQEHSYSHKHDTIFFYSKSSEWSFDADAVGELRGDVKRNNMKRVWMRRVAHTGPLNPLAKFTSITMMKRLRPQMSGRTSAIFNRKTLKGLDILLRNQKNCCIALSRVPRTAAIWFSIFSVVLAPRSLSQKSWVANGSAVISGDSQFTQLANV